MAAGFNGTDQRLDLALEAGFDWEITTPQSYGCWIIEPTNWRNGGGRPAVSTRYGTFLVNVAEEIRR